MLHPRHQPWDTVPLETLNPLISRKLITSDTTMLAQVFLSRGAVVPAHEHVNEQFT
jgi:hypothetical protein